LASDFSREMRGRTSIVRRDIIRPEPIVVTDRFWWCDFGQLRPFSVQSDPDDRAPLSLPLKYGASHAGASEICPYERRSVGAKISDLKPSLTEHSDRVGISGVLGFADEIHGLARQAQRDFEAARRAALVQMISAHDG
jgi:hypothetical protein